MTTVISSEAIVDQSYSSFATVNTFYEHYFSPIRRCGVDGSIVGVYGLRIFFLGAHVARCLKIEGQIESLWL
jgi:hypothetical protein